MADLGYVLSSLNALPVEQRPVWTRIFRSILRDLRFGHPSGDTNDPAENFGAAFLTGTTASTPGDEFVLMHGFGRAPYLLIPVLPLDTVGRTLVPLTVTRAADSSRVYLSSTEADTEFTCLVEG